MSELYWMVNIVNGSRAQKFTKLYRECGVSLVMETSGEGTAVSDILSIFGLEATEKKILLSVVTGVSACDAHPMTVNAAISNAGRRRMLFRFIA